MKKQFFRRIAAALLALMLAVPAFPGTAEAAEKASAGDLMAFGSQVNEMVEQFGLSAENEILSAGGALSEFATGRLIVKSRQAVDPLDALDVVSGFRDLYVLQFASAEAAHAAWEYYRALDSVLYVQPDQIYELSPVETDGAGGDVQLLAKDYRSWGYAQWGMNMDAYHQWLLGKVGSESALPKMVVAVIDTGVYMQHEVMQGRMASTGYDFVNDDNDATDDNNHGTHVAGIVLDGSLSNVSILPVKVLNAAGRGSSLNIALGIFYAADQGADVINMSLGGSGYNYLEKEAIDYAVAKGIPVVVAAGNEAMDAVNYSPAQFDNVICVAAAGMSYYDDSVELAEYSNYGDVVDVTAPGSGVYSSVLLPDWAEIGATNYYDYFDGTSMAAPHVAAAVAMLLSSDTTLTPGQVELLLEKACTIPVEENYWYDYVPVPDMLSMESLITADEGGLTISRTEAVCCPGQTLVLAAGTAADVVWTSSNRSVATVAADGTVTCLALGSAVITATLGGKSASCALTVTELELYEGEVILYPGGSCILTPVANCDPAPAFTWSISEEDQQYLGFFGFGDKYPGLTYPTPSDSVAVEARFDLPGSKTVHVVGTLGEYSISIPVQVLVPEKDWYSDSAVFEISTEAELREMAAVLAYGGVNGFAGKTLKLVADIEMTEEWTLMTGFDGTLDGNGHTITNFTVTDACEDYIGLFGTLGATGVIRDLTLRGSVSQCQEDLHEHGYAGGFVGGSYGTVENCTFDGTVDGGDFTGGIAGGLFEGGRIVNCRTVGAVNGGYYTGGITGDTEGVILGCLNEADVTGYECVGGIVGYSISPVVECENYGAVFGESMVGGINGYCYEFAGLVMLCGNYGEVSGMGGVGGILGGGESGYNAPVVDSCVNVGEVFSMGLMMYDMEGIGGIVGGGYVNIYNCRNGGSVTAEDGAMALGGIFGNTYWTTVRNCINLGAVGEQGLELTYVGGIVGLGDSVTLENCASLGGVRGTDDVAALIGYADGYYGSTLDHCYALSDRYANGIYTDSTCAVVDSSTLQTDQTLTVGSYMGTDLMELLNAYVWQNYLEVEEEPDDDDDYYEETAHPDLCFWIITEEYSLLRAKGISLDGGKPVLLAMENAETVDEVTCFAALYGDGGKMTKGTLVSFWVDGTDTYLAQVDSGERAYTSAKIIVVGENFAPLSAPVPVP